MDRTRRSVLAVTALLVCLSIWGTPRSGQALTPEQAGEARRTIVAWLECEECNRGELKEVVKLGKVAVPTLDTSLRGGPSQASRESLRRHLVTAYQEMKEYEKTHPKSEVRRSEAEFVQNYMDNYIAQYQIRAAIAIAAVGGPDAKRSLDEAMRAPLRKDVQRVVNGSLKKLEQSSR